MLHAVIVYSGKHSSRYLDILLPALYKTARDEEGELNKTVFSAFYYKFFFVARRRVSFLILTSITWFQVEKCCMALGCFVDPDASINLCLHAVHST